MEGITQFFKGMVNSDDSGRIDRQENIERQDSASHWRGTVDELSDLRSS
jgi:hypothetical protein